MSATLVCFLALEMDNAEKIKLVLMELVCLVVEATRIAKVKNLALETNAKTLARTPQFVVRTLNVTSRIIKLLVSAPQDSKQIQHQIKVVFEFLQFVKLLKIVLKVTCVLQTNAVCLVMTQSHAQLAKDVTTASARKFAILTIIACPVRFVLMEFAFLVVPPTLIVPTLKSVFNQNANAEKDSSERPSDVLTSTSVARSYVIHQQSVKTFREPTNAFAQIKQSEILMEKLDVGNQLNVLNMTIVLIICHASKRNASIHVQSKSKLVETTLSVTSAIMKPNATVHQVT